MIYPAISIMQPWSWAILHAGKDVENRTWSFQKRYENTFILIHAGKKIDTEAIIHLHHLGYNVPEHLETGGIVGALIFSGKKVVSEWAEEGMCNWHIKRAWPVPFHPCKGSLGFFNVVYPHEIRMPI